MKRFVASVMVDDLPYEKSVVVEGRPKIPPKKLLKGTEIDDLFEAEETKDDLEDVLKKVKFEMTLNELYKHFHRRNVIQCLTLARNISRPIFTLANWEALQCLTLDVEANTLHFPEMLQHLDITFSDGINVDNLKAIDRLQKLSFLKVHTKLSTTEGGFGLSLRNLGCKVRNVLESVVLINLSKIYVRPDDIGYLLDVNPTITNFAITMEKSSECFNLFTESFLSYLTNQIRLEYFFVCGAKMFTPSSFGLNYRPFLNLQHLYIYNSDYFGDDQFNCLRDRTPLLHYLSIKHTKVHLESLGIFLVCHQNLVRVALFIEDYVTAFSDNLKFKLDVMRYILCFPSWHVENVCLCHYFADQYVENLRADLAGCIAKHGPLNEFVAQMEDPMSCSVDVLKDLAFQYVYRGGHVPCDENNDCVGGDCNVYYSDNLICSCLPSTNIH